MTNVLEQASQWLSDQIDEHASSPIVYRRGLSLSVPLVASKGKTTFDLTDSSGMLVNVESKDFIVSTDTLILGGQQQLPIEGDRIETIVEGKTYTYEVQNFGAEQPYRFCDPYRHKLRIHTKAVRVVSIIPI